MIEINGKVYRNIQEQVQENMDNIETLQGKHIYEHLVYASGKLKDAGVTKDDFTFVCRFRILNTSSTAITKDTLASVISTKFIPANGYVHYTTNEDEFTIYTIKTSILNRSVLEVETIPTEYTPAGVGSAVVGELTNVTDKVNTLL